METDFDFRRRPYRPRSGGSWRRRHRHLFAWVVLGGATIVLGISALASLALLGLGGMVSSAYFSIAEAVLPTSWHDELHAIPVFLHAAIGVALVAALVGVASELLD